MLWRALGGQLCRIPDSSELLSWRLCDVLDADNRLKDVVVVESKRLKGGRHIPKPPTRPEGHPDLCCCPDWAQ